MMRAMDPSNGEKIAAAWNRLEESQSLGVDEDKLPKVKGKGTEKNKHNRLNGKNGTVFTSISIDFFDSSSCSNC